MQGKRDAFKDHGESVPSSTSILNILANASDKVTGKKLSSEQIVAQSQTFILAGAPCKCDGGVELGLGLCTPH